MDLVTFATRVCRVMGIETIIGAFRLTTHLSDVGSDYVHSYQCSWRFEPELRCRRHRVLE